MAKKVRVNLYVDDEVLAEAQELGLNISKTCENCLKQAIRQLRPIYGENKPSDNPDGAHNDDRWAGPDLNRRPSARQADVLPS